MPLIISSKQQKFTMMVGLLIEWAYAHNYGLTFGHAWRDTETQWRMVQAGLSKTMNSKHLDRLAVDFNLFVNGIYTSKTEDYKPLGDYWKSLDPANRWGGDFKGFPDGGHFEYAG